LNPDPNHIPRGRFGLLMLPVTAVGVAVAGGVALALNGGTDTLRQVVLAVLVGSVATLGPVLLRLSREQWGLGMLVCGMTRAMLILGTAYLIETNGVDVAKRALYLGVVAGAVAILVAEAVVAVAILQGVEDARAKVKKSGGDPRVEHA
jgi:uncharacterized membrane protein